MKKKKIFVPLTLERVGSEGKFFTDNTILKFLGSIVGSILVILIIWSQLQPLVGDAIGMFVGVIVGLILLFYLVRFWVLREKALFGLLRKLDQYSVVNVGEFSDIYDVVDNICMHDSGYMSMLVTVTRGSTLGISEQEYNQYFESIKKFEDSIISDGYKFKSFNCEMPKIQDDIFLKQRDNCRKNNFTVLERNLDVKNTYIQTLMNKCLRDEMFVYVIISYADDPQHFKMRVQQKISSLTNKHIQTIHIMNTQEINNFAKEFFDVDYFEMDKVSSEDLKDVLTLGEELNL